MRLERLSAAADSSALLRASRRVTETSVLARATIAVARLSARAVRRLVTVSKGPVHDPSQDDAAIRKLFLSSRLTTGIDRALVSSVRAWERARGESSAFAIARVDLPSRVWMAGMALIAAVITNAVLLVAVGVPMSPLAWLLRAAGVAFGVLGARYPERVAAAWQSWRRRA
jgi:hypothetical protein